jgi:hypothetical protein
MSEKVKKITTAAVLIAAMCSPATAYNQDQYLKEQWARKETEKPSPASTMAPLNERSHGNYRMNRAVSGNGCDGFGVVYLYEIEQAAAQAVADSDPVSAFRDILEPRMKKLTEKYQDIYSPFDLRDLFRPDMKKVDEKTIRECLPTFSKLIENVKARSDEATKRKTEAENWERSAEGQVTLGYALFRLVRYCNEVRRGYLMKYVNDEELDRANLVIKSLVAKAKAGSPGLDTDTLWSKAGDLANDKPVGIEACHSYLDQLITMSPIAVYNNRKPE